MFQNWVMGFFLSWFWLVLPFFSNISNANSISKPGCLSHCGNIQIKYPFGIIVQNKSCSIDPLYNIICDNTFSPPKPFLPLPTGKLEVVDISERQLRIKNNLMSSICYTNKRLTSNITGTELKLAYTPFELSDTKNKFIVIGCDIMGAFGGPYDGDINSPSATISGCGLTCPIKQDFKNGSCMGVGCCQVSLPNKLKFFQAHIFDLHLIGTNVPSYNSCGHAFLAEQNKYEFNSIDINDPTFKNRTEDNVPFVVDWVVSANETCKQAQKNVSSYACQQNSRCIDFNSDFNSDMKGYHCECLHGYQGNPYLTPGCTDVDECLGAKYLCLHSCINTQGSFKCPCPKGYEGDGRNNGTGCVTKRSTFARNLSLCVSFGLLILGILLSWVYFTIRRKKIMKMREKFFSQNGGILLKQKLSTNGSESTDMSKIFSMEELNSATNNYKEDQILGKGGHGTVYKGILKDGQEVAIKRAKVTDRSQIEQFINEVVILTQINHRNVVKLLGCCLETEVPTLVYEFISNGTLYEHIHGSYGFSWLTWENCVRLATEVADALAYLHSAASIPIIHRDVKSANILINETFSAKISDFGASRLIPVDQTQVTTLVQGTLGYLDPEYFLTSQLTEKSDVYSFGIVLAELLTREKPLSFDREMENRSMATYFTLSMEEGRLFDIIDPQLVEEASIEQLCTMANLVRKCLNIIGKDRPTMKEVATELEALKKQIKQPQFDEHNEDITTSLND